MHSRCKSKSLWHLLLGGSSLLFWQGDSISKLMFSFKELIPPASRPLPFVTREYYPPLYTSPSYHMLTQFISSAGCARAAPRLMGSVPCALHLPIPLLMTQTAPSAPDVPCPAFTYFCFLCLQPPYHSCQIFAQDTHALDGFLGTENSNPFIMSVRVRMEVGYQIITNCKNIENVCIFGSKL